MKIARGIEVASFDDFVRDALRSLVHPISASTLSPARARAGGAMFVSPALQRGEQYTIVEWESRRDGAIWRTRTQAFSSIVSSAPRIAPPPHPGGTCPRTLCLPVRHRAQRGILAHHRRRNGQPRPFADRLTRGLCACPRRAEAQGQFLPVDGTRLFLAGRLRRVQRESIACAGREEVHSKSGDASLQTQLRRGICCPSAQLWNRVRRALRLRAKWKSRRPYGTRFDLDCTRPHAEARG